MTFDQIFGSKKKKPKTQRVGKLLDVSSYVNDVIDFNSILTTTDNTASVVVKRSSSVKKAIKKKSSSAKKGRKSTSKKKSEFFDFFGIFKKI